MAVEFFDCEQGSPEWFELRRGIPTASCFSHILAKGQGKMRKGYLNRLAAEIVSGECLETYINGDMRRGQEREEEDRKGYAFDHDIEPVRIGFAKNGGIGCSPDALIGEDGVLELKSVRGDLLIDFLDRNEFPPEYKAQCQGNLFVLEREWIDLRCSWRGMPPFEIRMKRDENYISMLASEISLFLADLDATVERINAQWSL